MVEVSSDKYWQSCAQRPNGAHQTGGQRIASKEAGAFAGINVVGHERLLKWKERADIASTGIHRGDDADDDKQEK